MLCKVFIISELSFLCRHCLGYEIQDGGRSTVNAYISIYNQICNMVYMHSYRCVKMICHPWSASCQLAIANIVKQSEAKLVV